MLSLFGLKPSPKTEADRRRAVREPVRLAATIILSRSRSVPCETLDLSSGGARIDLPRDRILPQEFDLLVPARKLRRRAKLVWRNDQALGVEFL